MRNVSNEEINHLTAEVSRLKAELEEHNADNCPWRAEVKRLRAEMEKLRGPLLDELTWEWVDGRVDCARAEEREACAQLVHQRYEEVDSETGVEGELLRLEEAIRTRR